MNLDPFYEKSWKRKKKINKVLYTFAAIALIIMAYNYCGKPEPKLVPSHGGDKTKNILEELHKLP